MAIYKIEALIEAEDDLDEADLALTLEGLLPFKVQDIQVTLKYMK